jgi:hypothetical protein
MHCSRVRAIEVFRAQIDQFEAALANFQGSDLILAMHRATLEKAKQDLELTIMRDNACACGTEET